MTTRVYLKSINEFGYRVRPMLGLADSEVVLGDDNKQYGLAGRDVARNLVDPATGRDGEDNPYQLPLDFRTVGIRVLTAAGVDPAVQGAMFNSFMARFTRDQRMRYVRQFQDIDPADSAATAAFVAAMLALLAPDASSQL